MVDRGQDRLQHRGGDGRGAHPAVERLRWASPRRLHAHAAALLTLTNGARNWMSGRILANSSPIPQLLLGLFQLTNIKIFVSRCGYFDL